MILVAVHSLWVPEYYLLNVKVGLRSAPGFQVQSPGSVVSPPVISSPCLCGFPHINKTKVELGTLLLYVKDFSMFEVVYWFQYCCAESQASVNLRRFDLRHLLLGLLGVQGL